MERLREAQAGQRLWNKKRRKTKHYNTMQKRASESWGSLVFFHSHESLYSVSEWKTIDFRFPRSSILTRTAFRPFFWISSIFPKVFLTLVSWMKKFRILFRFPSWENDKNEIPLKVEHTFFKFGWINFAVMITWHFRKKRFFASSLKFESYLINV